MVSKGQLFHFGLLTPELEREFVDGVAKLGTRRASFLVGCDTPLHVLALNLVGFSGSLKEIPLREKNPLEYE